MLLKSLNVQVVLYIHKILAFVSRAWESVSPNVFMCEGEKLMSDMIIIVLCLTF